MEEGGSKALGRAIGDARRARGMTQQDLCAAADLSYSTLAKIERGAIRTPSVFTVAAIAEATGTSVEALLGGKQLAQLSDERSYKVSKSGIQFVYFDINGVMVNFYHQAFSKIAIQTGASPEQVESISWRFNDQVCRGEMSVEQFNQELAKALGVSQIDWQHFYMSTVQPIEEAQACFEWAKEHYQVGLLSNIFPGFIEDMQTRGILPKLDNVTVVDSSRVGVIKPEIKIYDIATNRAGVPPESILFIDDSRTNLIAAERFGWRGLWFDDFRPAESANRIRTALEF